MRLELRETRRVKQLGDFYSVFGAPLKLRNFRQICDQLSADGQREELRGELIGAITTKKPIAKFTGTGQMRSRHKLFGEYPSHRDGE
jgi:hypothetical protein